MLQIRLGYELIFQCPQPTPMIMNLHIHHTRVDDVIRPDSMNCEPWVARVSYHDGFGNLCTRLVAPAGRLRITADALIRDLGLPDPVMADAQEHAVENL